MAGKGAKKSAHIALSTFFSGAKCEDTDFLQFSFDSFFLSFN
jgi:hypothetical protein